MKKKLSFCLLFLTIIGIQAQNSETNAEKKHRYFGFGVTTNLFRSSELSNFDIPGNRFYLNVDPIKYARVDFQFSTNKTSYVQTMNNRDFNLEDYSKVWAIGFFGQLPLDDMSVYIGVRYGKNKYQNQHVQSDYIYPSGYTYFSVSDDGVKRYIEPTIGGEYRFGNRFSVGGEFRILFLEDEYSAYGATSLDVTNLVISESSVFFRFFPF